MSQGNNAPNLNLQIELQEDSMNTQSQQQREANLIIKGESLKSYSRYQIKQLCYSLAAKGHLQLAFRLRDYSNQLLQKQLQQRCKQLEKKLLKQVQARVYAICLEEIRTEKKRDKKAEIKDYFFKPILSFFGFGHVENNLKLKSRGLSIKQQQETLLEKYSNDEFVSNNNFENERH